MILKCARCSTRNSHWARHCTACWLPLDASMRVEAGTSARRFGDGSADGAADTTATNTATERAATTSSTTTKTAVIAAEKHETSPLIHQLSIEAEHVHALADAGIHTLEHVAESLPATLAHALRAWTHIDPEALIARAQHLLHPAHTDGAQLQQAKTQAAAQQPDPEPWWKA